MELSKETKRKITSMVNSAKRTKQLQIELEELLMKEFNLTCLEDLEDNGINDCIIDAVIQSFNSKETISLIEKIGSDL